MLKQDRATAPCDSTETGGVPGEGAALFAVVEGAIGGHVAVARGRFEAGAVDVLPALDGTRLDIEKEESGSPPR